MAHDGDLAIFTRGSEFFGDIPAIVLLPAFPFDHRMWEAVVRRFESVPVIALDPPGFGDSSLPIDAPSLELYADMVAQVVRTRGAKRVVVCGNSMGGYTALALIERHPRLVAGLGLIGTSAAFDSPDKRAQRTEMAISALMGRAQDQLAASVPHLVAHQTVQSHPDIVQMLQSWVHEASDEAIAWAQRAMAQRPGRLEVLQRARVPGIVLRGEQDTATRGSDADAMAKALGETNYDPIPRAGHLIPVEQPGTVTRAIMRLYRRAASADKRLGL